MAEMKNPLLEVGQPMMAEFVKLPTQADMYFKTMFPLKRTYRFDLTAVNGTESYPIVANLVAFDTKSPEKSRKKVGTWSGKLNKLSISRKKDEIRIAEAQDLQNIASYTEDKEAMNLIRDMVYDDVDFCVKGIENKIELDAMRVASSGKLTFNVAYDGKGNATADEISYNVPEDNFTGAKTKWATSATADGIADIKAMQKAIKDKGFAKPMFAFMDESAFDLLIAQDATKKRCVSVLLNATNMTEYSLLTLEQVNSYMRANHLPEIVIIDRQVSVEDDNGTIRTINAWNTNVVTLAPTKQLGYIYWKQVVRVENTASQQTFGEYYKVTRYGEENPMIEVTMAECYAIPVLMNRDSLCFINIAKTTWNNGAE